MDYRYNRDPRFIEIATLLLIFLVVAVLSFILDGLAMFGVVIAAMFAMDRLYHNNRHNH